MHSCHLALLPTDCVVSCLPNWLAVSTSHYYWSLSGLCTVRMDFVLIAVLGVLVCTLVRRFRVACSVFASAGLLLKGQLRRTLQVNSCAIQVLIAG